MQPSDLEEEDWSKKKEEDFLAIIVNHDDTIFRENTEWQIVQNVPLSIYRREISNSN